MRPDRFWYGLSAGLVAPVLGLWLYGVLVTTAVWRQMTAVEFLRTTILGVKSNIAPALSISLFASVGLFFLFDRKDRHKAMRGVIASLFIYGVVILVLLIRWGSDYM
ncbi:MAG: hypothetical protein QM724_11225 [Flavobacteriales bacterium]